MTFNLRGTRLVCTRMSVFPSDLSQDVCDDGELSEYAVTEEGILKMSHVYLLQSLSRYL